MTSSTFFSDSHNPSLTPLLRSVHLSHYILSTLPDFIVPWSFSTLSVSALDISFPLPVSFWPRKLSWRMILYFDSFLIVFTLPSCYSRIKVNQRQSQLLSGVFNFCFRPFLVHGGDFSTKQNTTCRSSQNTSVCFQTPMLIWKWQERKLVRQTWRIIQGFLVKDLISMMWMTNSLPQWGWSGCEKGLNIWQVVELMLHLQIPNTQKWPVDHTSSTCLSFRVLKKAKDISCLKSACQWDASLMGTSFVPLYFYIYFE